MSDKMKNFTVVVDIEELRNIYEKYGQETANSAISKIVDSLKGKINKAADFTSCQPVKTLLIEG